MFFRGVCKYLLLCPNIMHTIRIFWQWGTFLCAFLLESSFHFPMTCLKCAGCWSMAIPSHNPSYFVMQFNIEIWGGGMFVWMFSSNFKMKIETRASPGSSLVNQYISHWFLRAFLVYSWLWIDENCTFWKNFYKKGQWKGPLKVRKMYSLQIEN